MAKSDESKLEQQIKEISRGRIFPSSINQTNPEGITMNYPLRLLTKIMNYVSGVFDVSKKSLESQTGYTSDRLYKLGLTQIFKINKKYQRK